MKNDYEIVIGLEIHVQLATESKAFCSDAVQFGQAPNTLVSPVSLGHPGVLPRLNEKQVAYAVKLGLATNCRINQENRFDRKNYFYPDLPKGFQTSQDALPICVEGYLDIKVDDNIKRIGITRIHMEEDAGKLIHDLDKHYSMVDLNRAGTPLLEIVSEPDLRSSEEAMAYISAIRQIVRYLEVSDGNMEEGSMRCDCNVSVRKLGDKKLGNRCEVKNVNSIRNAKRAIEFEAQRQIEILENGGMVEQQTRSFDADNGTTFALRGKEDAHDYRYFPEPDLPPVVITDFYLTTIKNEMPALPDELLKKFIAEYELSEYDAKILTEEKATATYYLDILKYTKNYKAAANWIINDIRSFLNDTASSIDNFEITPKYIAELIALIESEVVSYTIASRDLFPLMLKNPSVSPKTLASKHKLLQTKDDDFITQIAMAALEKYPEKVEEYNNLPNSGKGKKRKKGLLSMFMGEVMKQSRGKVNPKMATEALLKLLEK